MSTLTLEELSEYRIQFGKYGPKWENGEIIQEGERLDEIPLKYLDYLRGCNLKDATAKIYIDQYLGNPTINKLLEEELRL